jgi:hypothetical protein
MIHNLPLDEFMSWKDGENEVKINGVRRPL